jgi:UDP-2,3-diacylglucosamine pyrophosphatase LpxH
MISGLLLVTALISLTPVMCWAQPASQPAEAAVVAVVPFAAPLSGPRFRVFVSDLHFGIGRRADGQWHPTEDFRWPKALGGFLEEISRRGHERTDLVIVGDFLEMWQPPPEISCVGKSADLGCTLGEMHLLAGMIARAHADSLAVLRAFAERGENRLHIIPGNHDSTLRYDRVWAPIGEALNAASGRVNLVVAGIWSSPDGRIVAEHGHQIGLDVNRYETWPRVVQRVDQTDYVIRPWGELFVQKLFNEQEATYPIIDNLSPESAGARYRAADRGLWGSAADIARLLFFNLLETSPTQQAVMLGPNATGKREWNVTIARKLGADLFLKGLSPQDPLRVQIETGGTQADAIKAELEALARDRLPEEEVLHLCDLIADRGEGGLCLDRQLGSVAQHLLVAKAKVIARHLRGRQEQFRPMRLFVYGHTHQYEKPWTVQVNVVPFTVVNTGAFQRLVSDAGFRRMIGNMSPEEGLRKLALERLAPCYTAVLVDEYPDGQLPKAEVWAWRMEEGGSGGLVAPDDRRCQ